MPSYQSSHQTVLQPAYLHILHNQKLSRKEYQKLFRRLQSFLPCLQPVFQAVHSLHQL